PRVLDPLPRWILALLQVSGDARQRDNRADPKNCPRAVLGEGPHVTGALSHLLASLLGEGLDVLDERGRQLLRSRNSAMEPETLGLGPEGLELVSPTFVDAPVRLPAIGPCLVIGRDGLVQAELRAAELRPRVELRLGDGLPPHGPLGGHMQSVKLCLRRVVVAARRFRIERELADLAGEILVERRPTECHLLDRVLAITDGVVELTDARTVCAAIVRRIADEESA